MPLKVGAVELSDQEVTEFREVFDLVDKDHGGAIDAAEVMELMQMLGMKPSKAEVETMISEIDEDGNGQVDFAEFLQVMAGPQQLPYAKKELLTAFKTFSDTGNPAGCITPAELEKALNYCHDKLTSEEVRKLVGSIEPRDDGMINYLEKINLFLNK